MGHFTLVFSKEEAVEYTIDGLIHEAQSMMPKAEFQRLKENRPEHHAPLWHVYGVLGHAYAVIEASKLLKEATDVDIVLEAVLHDIGKFYQFRAALRTFDRGGDPSPIYRGHEALSSRRARKLKLHEDSVAAIEWHMFGYLPIEDDTLLDKLSNTNAVLKWLVLFPAYPTRKRFTPMQTKQT